MINPVNQKDLVTLWDQSHVRKGTHFPYFEGICPLLQWDISREILRFFNSVVSFKLGLQCIQKEMI